AVARRPALDHVGDVHVAAAQSHAAGDDLGQQLAGAADERFALAIFLLSRAFADEHELRLGLADAEHDLRASRAELAAATIADLVADRAQRVLGGPSESLFARPTGARRGVRQRIPRRYHARVRRARRARKPI